MTRRGKRSNNVKNVDAIRLSDIIYNNKKPKQCLVKLSNRYNKLFLNGYVRSECKINNDNIIPWDIINLLSIWYGGVIKWRFNDETLDKLLNASITINNEAAKTNVIQKYLLFESKLSKNGIYLNHAPYIMNSYYYTELLNKHISYRWQIHNELKQKWKKSIVDQETKYFFSHKFYRDQWCLCCTPNDKNGDLILYLLLFKMPLNAKSIKIRVEFYLQSKDFDIRWTYIGIMNYNKYSIGWPSNKFPTHLFNKISSSLSFRVVITYLNLFNFENQKLAQKDWCVT